MNFSFLFKPNARGEWMILNLEGENGGEKVDHGSGGMSPLRAA